MRAERVGGLRGTPLKARAGLVTCSEEGSYVRLIDFCITQQRGTRAHLHVRMLGWAGSGTGTKTGYGHPTVGNSVGPYATTRIRTSAPVSAFQTMTSLSHDPVTTNFPSGENARALMYDD